MPELICRVLVDGLRCDRDLTLKEITKVGGYNNELYECEVGHRSKFIYKPIETKRHIYRKFTNSMFWHFCDNCTSWPTEDFVEVNSPEHPPHGGFCVECIQKRKDGECSGWDVGPD